jgi:pyruvate/2-oxoglutarate dehydrogenase complex dihydrolipoamide dehydrogenase (E3) component
LNWRRQDRYDLVVIGAGSAGLVAADFAARFGARVLLIEKSRIGGDCTWTGCVPSKALLHAASLAHRSRVASHLGILVGSVEIDFPTVMRQVRQAVARVYSFETPEQLARRGVAVEVGQARFLDEHSVAVGGRRVQGRSFVVCTGAGPQHSTVAGLDAVPYLTYEEVFELDQLPDRLLVLGGGPVGVELAQAFARLGSRVTLLEKASRVLSPADPEAGFLLARVLAAEGVTIETGFEAVDARDTGGEIVLSSKRASFAGDRLLVATGRRPDVEGLDLERAGVEFDERGVRVDPDLKTRQSHIYAAGDVTGSFQFTHYAGWQGYRAARNALFPGSARGLAETVPWAVFTEPELSQVGLTEQQAAERGMKIAVHRLPLERVDRAQTLAETEGFIKIVSSTAGRILGASIVGPAAADVANELAVAMARGVDLSHLASIMHIYPTIGLGVQQLASEFAFGQATRGLRGAVARVLMTRARLSRRRFHEA